MNRTFPSRALVLAGVLAAAGAVHAATLPDDESSAPSSIQAQTWYFPDGSSHTVRLDGPALTASAPDTAVLGAGRAMPLADDSVDQPSDAITQTWFFPDGSSHTVQLAAATPPPEQTSVLGAARDPLR